MRRPRKKYKAPRPVGRPRKESKVFKCRHKMIDRKECKDFKSAMITLSFLVGINYKVLARVMIRGIITEGESIPGIDVMMKSLRELEN